MCLQALFAGKHSIAVGALYAARRGRTLHHEVGQGGRPGPSTSMPLGAAGSCLLSADAVRHHVILGRRARAAGAQIHVARLFAPIPGIEHRVAHWRAAARHRCRGARTLRRVQLHSPRSDPLWYPLYTLYTHSTTLAQYNCLFANLCWIYQHFAENTALI